jgi:signal transduction histidine kinase
LALQPGSSSVEAAVAELDRAASAGLPIDAFVAFLTDQVRAMARCEEVVLLVNEESGDQLVPNPARQADDPFSSRVHARGPLATWLRVNDRAFATRDGYIWDDLAEDERQTLHAGSVQAVLPLVSDDTLDGILLVSDTRPSWVPAPDLLERLQAFAHRAASPWQAVLRQYSERQTAQAAYRAHQLSTAGQLAASVAHEVRNPLSAIRSIVQLVRDTHPEPDRQDSLLCEVMDEVDRIDRTVSGLLGLARPHVSETVRLDMATLVKDVVRFMETYLRRAGLTISGNFSGPLPVVVDQREFRQVLLNILLNACQACGPGATIQVTCGPAVAGTQRVGETVIRDTGVGISPEDLARVFDAFFTTKPTGTGLGLGWSRDLLRRHGGDICVDSVRGAGTTVSITLPLIGDIHGSHSDR